MDKLTEKTAAIQKTFLLVPLAEPFVFTFRSDNPSCYEHHHYPTNKSNRNPFSNLQQSSLTLSLNPASAKLCLFCIILGTENNLRILSLQFMRQLIVKFIICFE